MNIKNLPPIAFDEFYTLDRYLDKLYKEELKTVDDEYEAYRNVIYKFFGEHHILGYKHASKKMREMREKVLDLRDNTLKLIKLKNGKSLDFIMDENGVIEDEDGKYRYDFGYHTLYQWSDENHIWIYKEHISSKELIKRYYYLLVEEANKVVKDNMLRYISDRLYRRMRIDNLFETNRPDIMYI